jgi:hypothetical protein
VFSRHHFWCANVLISSVRCELSPYQSNRDIGPLDVQQRHGRIVAVLYARDLRRLNAQNAG